MAVELLRPDGRPSFDAIYLRFALDLAGASTCRRLQVGCVITDLDGTEILGHGYNGRARGLPNGCARDEPGACGCVHAESNAALKCGLRGGMPKLVYCSHQPCEACAQVLVQIRGVARVLYDLATLALSVAVFLWSVHWSMANADTQYGKLWPQILATALGYGVFLAALGGAFALRRVLFRHRG